MLLLPALVLAEAEVGPDAYIIDVVEGQFLLKDTELTLVDDMLKPIAIGFRNGQALVQVTTPEGVVDLDLGEVQVLLTENAAPYVREMEFEAEDGHGPLCLICGRSMAIGNHTVMPCGHQGCLKVADHLQICTACNQFVCNGKDHSVCASCKVRWCVHVDIECEYTRNPAPTPMTTKTPDGKTKYGWVETDGTAVHGDPVGEPQTWSPAQDYIDSKSPPGSGGTGGSTGGFGGN